jgi:prophage regulatory protein
MKPTAEQLSARLDAALTVLDDLRRELHGVKKHLQAANLEAPPVVVVEPIRNDDDRFLCTKEVIKVSSLSRTSIWAAMKRGDFPKSVKLSSGRVGWRARDIRSWQERRS